MNWKARIASIEDADNKATQDYSLTVHAWSATLSLKADDYSLATLNVQQDVCVDSGSPVDIASAEDEVPTI